MKLAWQRGTFVYVLQGSPDRKAEALWYSVLFGARVPIHWEFRCIKELFQ